MNSICLKAQKSFNSTSFVRKSKIFNFILSKVIPIHISTRFAFFPLKFKFYQKMELAFVSDENEKSFRFLKRVNNKCERIWKYSFRMVIGGFSASTTSVCTATILYCLLTKQPLDIQFIYLK